MKQTHKPIRLFWSENYAPKPLVIEAVIAKVLESMSQKINLYPADLYTDTIDVIAEDYGVERENLLLAHGVEGLVHLISKTYLSRNKFGGSLSPSFFVFENNLIRANAPVLYPVGIGEKVKISTFVKKISKTSVFFLASPNKETGGYALSHEDIEQVLKQYKGLFVVDECYLGFGGMSVRDLLSEYNNLLILRSVSKAEGLASLRIGIAIGAKKVIAKLKYHLHDIEYDSINSIQLMLLKELYPYFPRIWDNSRKFFDDFYEQVRLRFPEHAVRKTLATNIFFDIRPSKVKAHELIMSMNGSGYLLAPFNPLNNHSRFTMFKNIITLSPPPMEYWNDFFESLKSALEG